MSIPALYWFWGHWTSDSYIWTSWGFRYWRIWVLTSALVSQLKDSSNISLPYSRLTVSNYFIFVEYFGKNVLHISDIINFWSPRWNSEAPLCCADLIILKYKEYLEILTGETLSNKKKSFQTARIWGNNVEAAVHSPTSCCKVSVFPAHIKALFTSPVRWFCECCRGLEHVGVTESAHRKDLLRQQTCK